MKNTNNISEIANLIILNMTCDEKMDLPMIEEGLSRAYLLGYNKAQAEYKDAMTLNEYQAKAMMTCMPSCHNLSYMLLNLVGEVGEFSSKIAKGIRKENLIIKENDLFGYDDLLDKIEINHEDEVFDGFDTLYPASLTLKPV